MVMINNSIIKRAIEEAKISTFHQRHGCVIFKGNRILNTAHNEIRYCNRLDVRYKKWINSLHAEQKAILFSRFDPFDNLTSSKPCPVCMGLIQNVGIGKIYYSTKIGQIVEFKGDTC